ncbi:MAG: tetratricopeptide repeat protein, partial [Planctomycetota bacterium]
DRTAASKLPDREKRSRDYAAWSDVALQAAYQLGQAVNGIERKAGRGYREVFLGRMEDLRRRVPDILDRKFGQLALVTQARALFAHGRRADGVSLALEVSRRGEEIKAERAWADGIAHRADLLLGEFLESGEIELKTEALFRAATARYRLREWDAAVEASRKVLKSCKSSRDLREFAVPTLFRIGAARFHQKRFLEAYEAYDQIVAKYVHLAGDQAGEAAYWRYRCAEKQHAATGDRADERRKDRAWREFVGQFPDHPRAEQGFFGRIRSRIEKGEHAQALEELRKGSPERSALKAYYEALCLSKLGRHGEVVEVLDGYEDEFEKAEGVPSLAYVMYLRLESRLALGDLAGAERDAAALKEKYPRSPRITPSFRLLGLAYHEAAKEPEGRKKNLTRAAEHFLTWLLHQADPRPGDYETVAGWFLEVGARGNAGRCIEKVVELTRVLPQEERRERWAGLIEPLERVVIPERGDHARVRELLVDQDLTKAELQELMKKIYAVGSFLDLLALLYAEAGHTQDLLRAANLLSVLSRADGKKVYTRTWWGWQLRIMRAYVTYGEVRKERRYLRHAVARYERWQALGVLENCPLKDELREVYERAKKK